MATIDLLGLPSHCQLPKLVILFKGLLKREGIMNFWIKEMSDIRGSDLKSAKVEFYSSDEAYRALKVLDGFNFTLGQYGYPLSARIDYEERGRTRRRSPSPFNYRSREFEYQDRYNEPSYSRHDGYLRERSRSPLLRQEASKLDLEIELLRKQRMIIEEERKILLERKKLDLVKEFGPSALKEFEYIEEDRSRERGRDRMYRAERAPDRRPPPRAPPARPPPQRPPRRDKVQVPQFLLPCKLLLAELKETMERLGTRTESFLLTKLLRATIRKRLAVLLEGKPILPGAKIASLYRKRYPKHQDEDFVAKHLADVRACHMPSKGDDAARKADKPRDEAKKELGNNGTSEEVVAGYDQNIITEVNTSVTEPGLTPKEEPNTSTDTVNEKAASSEESAELLERPEGSRSVASSEALTLQDKCDEDWVEGEGAWDDPAAEPPQGEALDGVESVV